MQLLTFLLFLLHQNKQPIPYTRNTPYLEIVSNTTPKWCHSGATHSAPALRQMKCRATENETKSRLSIQWRLFENEKNASAVRFITVPRTCAKIHRRGKWSGRTGDLQQPTKNGNQHTQHAINRNGFKLYTISFLNIELFLHERRAPLSAATQSFDNNAIIH